MKLDGTVAIVAVPSGAALARRLMAEGATVVVTGADGDEVGRVLASGPEGPGRMAHFSGSVDSDAEVDALVEFISEQFVS